MKCGNKCLANCYEIYFERDVKFTKKIIKNRKIETINLVTLEYSHIHYIETIKIDFDKLIYTLGGVISLWFALSPMTITDLVLYLLNSSKKLMHRF